MDLDRIPRDERCLGQVVAVLAATLCGLVSAGCASPGPPRPPTLHLPALVTDLSAERSGDRVLLKWTTPSRTTDDLPVKGLMTAQLCRETGAAPATPATKTTTCAPVLRVAVVPGASQVADPLPRAMTTGPFALITYRIQILNSTEHSAGNSTVAAFATAGKAPVPLDALRATASEKGAVVEWNSEWSGTKGTPGSPSADAQVELIRTGGTPANSKAPAKTPHSSPLLSSTNKHKASPAAAQANPDEVHLRVAEIATGPTAGTIDATAKMGETYTYLGERVRTVSLGIHQLELHSAPSSPVTLEMRDTFPPTPPNGLATIPGADPTVGTSYIDLSWEPNSEPDLAGYLVYRQLARPNGDPQGPLARLTPLPVVAPAYRDVAVRAGQRYIYQVTAVDAAGNESAPSAKAQEGLDSSAPDPPK